jgi:hypothetical protein
MAWPAEEADSAAAPSSPKKGGGSKSKRDSQSSKSTRDSQSSTSKRPSSKRISKKGGKGPRSIDHAQRALGNGFRKPSQDGATEYANPLDEVFEVTAE